MTTEQATSRVASWIAQASESGKTLWLRVKDMSVTYDEQVALCSACGGDRNTLRSGEFHGDSYGRKWDIRIDPQLRGHVNPANGLVTY